MAGGRAVRKRSCRSMTGQAFHSICVARCIPSLPRPSASGTWCTFAMLVVCMSQCHNRQAAVESRSSRMPCCAVSADALASNGVMAGLQCARPWHAHVLLLLCALPQPALHRLVRCCKVQEGGEDWVRSGQVRLASCWWLVGSWHQEAQATMPCFLHVCSHSHDLCHCSAAAHAMVFGDADHASRRARQSPGASRVFKCPACTAPTAEWPADMPEGARLGHHLSSCGHRCLMLA